MKKKPTHFKQNSGGYLWKLSTQENLEHKELSGFFKRILQNGENHIVKTKACSVADPYLSWLDLDQTFHKGRIQILIWSRILIIVYVPKTFIEFCSCWKQKTDGIWQKQLKKLCGKFKRICFNFCPFEQVRIRIRTFLSESGSATANTHLHKVEKFNK